MIAAKKEFPQPCVIMRSNSQDFQNITNVFLVIEKDIYCEIPASEVAVALMCAFYVFNIQYTPGCSNIFTFLEFAFLKKKIKSRKQKIGNLMSQLELFPEE